MDFWVALRTLAGAEPAPSRLAARCAFCTRPQRKDAACGSGRYTSFFAAGAVGYVLRTRHGFRSLPAAVERCYGPVATFCFSVILLYRLWNEVWSNAAVVASFYGSVYSTQWWLAVVFSTACVRTRPPPRNANARPLCAAPRPGAFAAEARSRPRARSVPAVYTAMGGMRASLFSDALQAGGAPSPPATAAPSFSRRALPRA